MSWDVHAWRSSRMPAKGAGGIKETSTPPPPTHRLHPSMRPTAASRCRDDAASRCGNGAASRCGGAGERRGRRRAWGQRRASSATQRRRHRADTTRRARPQSPPRPPRGGQLFAPPLPTPTRPALQAASPRLPCSDRQPDKPHTPAARRAPCSPAPARSARRHPGRPWPNKNGERLRLSCRHRHSVILANTNQSADSSQINPARNMGQK